jgi:transposase-like protein
MGTYHQPNDKQLGRYATEFVGQTTTFDAFAKPGTVLEVEINLPRGLPVNNLKGSLTPNPWTWHPHLPGVTAAWLAQANGVSVRTIRRWRQQADPADADLCSMTAELGCAMAILRRPGSMLPLWSRMAIAELAWRGASYTKLARQFRCGESTVWRCVKGLSGSFAPLSGQRLLTRQQLDPAPGRQ